jgi:hypothetical protein
MVVASSGSHKVVGPSTEEKRTMIKQLTLFCTFAIFMLAVGGVVTPLQAHCEGRHTGDHPHCPPQVYDAYDVEIDPDGLDDPTKAVLPGVGLKWLYDGKMVGSLRPRSDFLDMGYFVVDDPELTPFENDILASDCFFDPPPDDSFPVYPWVKFGGILRKHRKSIAEGMFWFPGTTKAPAVQVLYLLKIEGTFTGDDPVNGFPKNEKVMTMNKWTLKVEGQGAEVISRSCVGEGEFDTTFDVKFFEVSIDP